MAFEPTKNNPKSPFQNSLNSESYSRYSCESCLCSIEHNFQKTGDSTPRTALKWAVHSHSTYISTLPVRTTIVERPGMCLCQPPSWSNGTKFSGGGRDVGFQVLSTRRGSPGVGSPATGRHLKPRHRKIPVSEHRSRTREQKLVHYTHRPIPDVVRRSRGQFTHLCRAERECKSAKWTLSPAQTTVLSFRCWSERKVVLDCLYCQ